MTRRRRDAAGAAPSARRCRRPDRSRATRRSRQDHRATSRDRSSARARRPLVGRASWPRCRSCSSASRAIGYQFATGIGTWGLNRTVGWAFDITNFVFWVGIGHAGTLISAILLLFRQKWRTSINRSAEAMTHLRRHVRRALPADPHGPAVARVLGRSRIPNTRGPLWVNFRSPLLWDVFAIGTYFTISLVFWYVGLIPDLATLRDRAAAGLRQAGLRAAVARAGTARRGPGSATRSCTCSSPASRRRSSLSVHTRRVVRLRDVGASRAGTRRSSRPTSSRARSSPASAMVLTLMLVARKVMHLEDYITQRHIDAMCKMILATGGIVGLAYLTEIFIGLVLREPLREVRVHEPRVRSHGLGVLDHGHLQRRPAAGSVVEAGPFAPGARVRPLAPRERRDVVRALRHHRDVALPRLPAVVLGRVRADARGDRRRCSGASACSSRCSSSSAGSCP